MKHFLKSAKSKIIFLVFVAVLISNGVFSQYYNWKYYTTSNTGSNKLPSNEINKIFQGKDSTYWIFTQNDCLCRNKDTIWDCYTDNNFYNPKKIAGDDSGNIFIIGNNRNIIKIEKDSFPKYTILIKATTYINDILFTSKGALIFTTSDGVFSYKNEIIDTIFYKQSYFAEYINLLEDKDSKLWFTSYTDVFIYNGDSVKKQVTDVFLTSYEITCMLPDLNGLIWAINDFNQVFLFEGNKWEMQTNIKLPESGVIISGLFDNENRLWLVADNSNIYIIKDSLISQPPPNNLYSYNTISCIFKDCFGQVLVGLSKHGIMIYKNDSLTEFNTNDGLIDSRVNDIIEDKNGNMWISTNAGISRFDGKSWQSYTDCNFLNAYSIGSLFCDDFGYIWAGLPNSSGINIFNGSSWSLMKYPTNSFQKIALDKNKDIIIVNRAGALKWDYSKLSIFPPNSYFQADMRDVVFDSKWVAWIASYGQGVIKYDGSEIVNYLRETSGICDNNGMSIYADSKDNIWYGSSMGVSKYQDGYWRKMVDLNISNVKSICEDYQGNIWFASQNSGIIMFDGSNFINITTKEGLLSNQVSKVLVDQYNNLWIGGTSGICVLDLNHLSINPNNNHVVPKVEIYPNPVSNELNINPKNLLPPYIYSITDLQGKEIMRGKVTESGTFSLDITELKPQVYLLKISNNKQSKVLRLIKTE